MWDREIVSVLRKAMQRQTKPIEIGGYVHEETRQLADVTDGAEHQRRLIYMDTTAAERERAKAQEDGWLAFFCYFPHHPPGVAERYIAHIRAAPLLVMRGFNTLHELRPVKVVPISRLQQIDTVAWRMAKEMLVVKYGVPSYEEFEKIVPDAMRHPALQQVWLSNLTSMLPELDVRTVSVGQDIVDSYVR